ncbi:MAG: phosphodiester glycosidase family protein [Patescibacteria group bacterium]|nr:phosphodiester glycosidase family protein [Patescibacteria group bacterium]
MATILKIPIPEVQKVHSFSERLVLPDSESTMVHVVRYDRETVLPRLVVFPEPTALPTWCAVNGIKEALTAGFYLHEPSSLLGDTWVNGHKIESVPFTKPWNDIRSAIALTGCKISIANRHELGTLPNGDLIQAGPQLVENGTIAYEEDADREGFRLNTGQFDSDITAGRYPRTALGYDENYIWSVAVDGRSTENVGLTIRETAEVMLSLGAQQAINLDGGASSVQISGGNITNNPRTGSNGITAAVPLGRPIRTAIIFETL